MKNEVKMRIRNRTADIIYGQMLQTTSSQVAKSALTIADSIQSEKVCNQVLGLAALLICIMHYYKLNHVDVLGIADNMVYSGDNNNMKPEFWAIRNYMKNDWELKI